MRRKGEGKKRGRRGMEERKDRKKRIGGRDGLVSERGRKEKGKERKDRKR